MSMIQNRLDALFTSAAQEIDRTGWDFVLARATRHRREQLGLTIEAAAELAGLQSSEWASLEDCWVPWDMDTLDAIAATLQVSHGDFHGLAAIVRIHQDLHQS